MAHARDFPYQVPNDLPSRAAVEATRDLHYPYRNRVPAHERIRNHDPLPASSPRPTNSVSATGWRVLVSTRNDGDCIALLRPSPSDSQAAHADNYRPSGKDTEASQVGCPLQLDVSACALLSKQDFERPGFACSLCLDTPWLEVPLLLLLLVQELRGNEHETEHLLGPLQADELYFIDSDSDDDFIRHYSTLRGPPGVEIMQQFMDE